MADQPRQGRPVQIGFYDIDRTIGQGNYAVVKLARHRVTKSEVAIKIIDKTQLDDANLKKVFREIEILKMLDHPNISKLYQVMQTDDFLYIVSEYACNGEIYELIARYGRLAEPDARSKFWQIIHAVRYCHQQGIVHRDLKTENLLLDAKMNIKIVDFGFGNFFRRGEELSTFCGSPPYAAPEVFEGKNYYGPEIDVWSLGVVLYVLVCGGLPFNGETLHILRDRVVAGRFRIPYFMSTGCENLIRKMLVLDPRKRLTIGQICEHPWMQDAGPEVRQDPLNAATRVTSQDGQPYNEHVLRLMHSLNIDENRTVKELRSKAFNNFTAIYFLLLERWREFSLRFPAQAEHRMSEEHRRPSTIADQAVIMFAVGSYRPALGDTRTSPFFRTTDGVDLNAPHHATQQQRIYMSGRQQSVVDGTSRPPLTLAEMSIDEGVEVEGSENSCENLNPAPAATAKPNLVSISSSAGSSDVASFDSTTDADALASALQSTPWAFTSGESLSSAAGLECQPAVVANQHVGPDTSANLQEGLLFGGGKRPSMPERCRLAVPSPSNTLKVPSEGGGQDGFFHSGRRASDGLVTRADVLQLQQLMKTAGIAELQKELETLPVPLDPRQPTETRSRRTELRSSRHQHSFEEGPCSGRLSPLSARKARQAANSIRPRLSRSRQPPATTISPLAELTTLCRMLPAGGAADCNGASLTSDHHIVQRQFQELVIDASKAPPTTVLHLPAVSFGLAPIGRVAIATCLSEQALTVSSAPLAAVSDISACHSQDSIHSNTANEVADRGVLDRGPLPLVQPSSVVDDGAVGPPRQNRVRRTLYSLTHQQTLSEEDIPELSPVSEQSAGASENRQSHGSMDVA